MNPSDTVVIKASSRRAARKLQALVGSDAQALFSMRRSTGRGAYRIPKRFLNPAQAITGIEEMRDGKDLHEVWET